MYKIYHSEGKDIFHVKFVFEHNETSLNFERKIEVAENFILTI